MSAFTKAIANVRLRSITSMICAAALLTIIVISGIFIDETRLSVNLEARNSSPSLQHLFGTDWLGRDMFLRTVKGITLSFSVGLLATVISTIIAVLLSILSTFSKKMDVIITWFIDLFLSMPHMVTLLLIAFAFGGGLKAVVIGLAFTHWPSLTRLLRTELFQVKNTQYVKVSRSLGKSSLWIAFHHYIPVLAPQILVGSILLFPHAILHEASITFLGFGLSPEVPAIGIILSESIKYLSSGLWWLAFFPGLTLLVMVGLFDFIGQKLRKFISPWQ